MITEDGKRALFEYFTGTRTRWAGAMILGTGETAESLSDTDVKFPIIASDIDVMVPEQQTQSVILRATFPTGLHAKVREVGIVSAGSTYDIQRIVSFDALSELFDGGVPDITYNRIGLQSTRVSAPASIVYTQQNFDFSQYTQQSTFRLALHNLSASSAQISIKIGQDAANYYNYNLAIPAGTGYKVFEWTKGSFGAVGQPRWSEASYIEFNVSGVPDMVLDGFIVKRQNTDPNVLFVSRTVFVEPVVKLSTLNMDFEYRVGMNFG